MGKFPRATHVFFLVERPPWSAVGVSTVLLAVGLSALAGMPARAQVPWDGGPGESRGSTLFDSALHPGPAAGRGTATAPAGVRFTGGLIPEILDLPRERMIPAHVFDDYDSAAIARSVVWRLHLRKEPDGAGPPAFDYYRDTEIQMAFPSDAIESIMRYGYLNVFQSRRSTGAPILRLRREAEDILADVMIVEGGHPSGGRDAPINKLRPKYAYLALKAPFDRPGRATVTGDHGNVFLVLKDSIKDRTTFTPFDSFRILRDEEGSDERERHTLFYRPKTLALPRIGDGYWEAQVWGEILPKDFDHFLVRCLGTTIPEADLRELIATGIPVYECGEPYPGGALRAGVRLR